MSSTNTHNASGSEAGSPSSGMGKTNRSLYTGLRFFFLVVVFCALGANPPRSPLPAFLNPTVTRGSELAVPKSMGLSTARSLRPRTTTTRSSLGAFPRSAVPGASASSSIGQSTSCAASGL